jgi:hypothetical protein
MSGVLAGLIGSFAPVATSYESIATFTGNGSAQTATFNSIPGTYKSLQIRFMSIAPSGQYPNPTIRYNNDTGTNYKYHWLDGYGSIAAGANTTNTAWPLIGSGNLSMYPTYPTVAVIDIIDYASTTKNKTSRSITGIDINGNGLITLQSMLYTSTTAITRIDIQSSVAYPTTTTIALYGIKG